MQENRTTVTTEAADTGHGVTEQQTVRHRSTVSGVVIAQRIVWFFVGLIVVFLSLRVLLLLLAANQGSAFVDFVYTIGGLFAAPFYGIFSYTPAYGQSVFEISSLVAIAMYILLGWGITKLLTLTRPHEEV